MDFYRKNVYRDEKKGTVTLTPDFIVGRSKDLMVRGRAFYAIWDEEQGLWSTDEYDVGRLVDKDLWDYAKTELAEEVVNVKSMRNFSDKSWSNYRMFMSNITDSFHQLDENLTFQDQETKQTDYVSRRLPYSLQEGDHSAWDELVGTLYSVDERAKIEWCIGAIVSGDSKKIQKFIALYGSPGTGKGTIINIVQKLFEGYVATFEAKALGSNNNAFATEAFKSNPLVAIQHDGDLSKIVDNTLLNSIVAHEEIRMNEKYKPSYTSRVNAMLMVGTNEPIKITSAKSGIVRRLIDVHPTGVTIPPNQYTSLMSRIDFELGAIAQHCLEVYRRMGKNYYNSYRPTEMMLQTDVVFNFIEYFYDVFKLQDGATLKQAYELYKEYCSTTGIDKPVPQYKLREELRNYFDSFKDRAEIDGQIVRSYYSGFSANKFKVPVKDDKAFSLVIEETVSLLDREFEKMPAQYSKADGTPQKYWDFSERIIDGVLKKPDSDRVVSTTLANIDTSREHYVKVPSNHIVIDFDLKGENGGKALERNLEAASAWPPTYAELSKSGAGVHLHYHYDGDASVLSREFSEGIEIKVFSGNSSLRRRLTKCNSVPVATINGGLPVKEKANVPTAETVRSERALRELISRNFRKEIHPGTKPSIDFIAKILSDAFESGLEYDLTDLKPKLVAFANNSSNQALACLKAVQQMRLKSEAVHQAEQPAPVMAKNEAPLVFFDIECFPNLFVVGWKYEDSDQIVKMINPKPKDMEDLMKFRLVGFNNRRYDNHMIYGCFLGYNNDQLYDLSTKLIGNKPGATFAAAYGISYADLWDITSKKQSLKKYEIELGIKHMELDLPWDQPVPQDKIQTVAEYNGNDVIATQKVWEARQSDVNARKILADLSGLTVNDPTAKHTAQIIFEGDRNPQQSFVYTKLSETFPGYVYDMGKSYYHDELVGEGGYVYAEPGIHRNVALLDVASMHPTSIINLNMFGRYTKNFKDLMDARLAIKRRDYDAASKMLDGKLFPYLTDREDNYDIGRANELSYALKIIINIVYGLTSATFDSPFRDKRNKDNIAAKRGALFMIDLKKAVQEQGYTVVHIKTDSIKIAEADKKIIKFVMDFGEKYGYVFEHENTYEKMALVNDAVYVARDDKGQWTATGTQFKVPYVFKTLFDDHPVLVEDLAETKQVSKGSMNLVFEDGRRIFVGRTGRFVPVTKESGIGASLVRSSEGKDYAVGGTKGYLWVESEAMIDRLDPMDVDMSYFRKLAEDAKRTIGKYGDFEEFVS